MNHFDKLRQLRKNLILLPGLKSYKDFDIAVEIGHYEHIATPLTLKQLLLLEIASEATVRRHLNALIESGMVEKNINPNDNRSVVFTLSRKAHRIFAECMEEIRTIMEELV